MSSSNDADTSSASSERLTGRVKWFNNKAGYGFITVTDGSRSGSDIFVHHSSIGVSSQQYKYLVQGEYVEFYLSVTKGGAHEFQASNVEGIKGGKLMCETRLEFKIARSSYKTSPTSDEETSEPVKMPRQKEAPTQTYAARTHTSVPKSNTVRTDEGDKKGWTLVKGKQTDKPVAKGRGRPSKKPNA